MQDRQLVQYTILLTATVSPSKNVEVSRSNPDLRFKDYNAALRFWLNLDDPRVSKLVLVENSGFDLSKFRTIVDTSNPFNKEVELISIVPVPIPSGLHYGWGELQMLDQAVMQSKLIAKADYCIKATGRLQFPTISRLLDSIPSNCRMMVDGRVTTSTEWESLQFLPPSLRRLVTLPFSLAYKTGAHVSTQLMLWTPEAYMEMLYGKFSIMNATNLSMMESVVFQQLTNRRTSQGVYLRFPTNCEPIGVGASLNDDYTSRSKAIMTWLRSLSRPFGIWI